MSISTLFLICCILLVHEERIATFPQTDEITKACFRLSTMLYLMLLQKCRLNTQGSSLRQGCAGPDTPCSRPLFPHSSPGRAPRHLLVRLWCGLRFCPLSLLPCYVVSARALIYVGQSWQLTNKQRWMEPALPFFTQ